MMQRQQMSGNEATPNQAASTEYLLSTPAQLPSFNQIKPSQGKHLPELLSEIVGWIEAAGILVWLHGEWGINALVNYQPGPSKELDLAVLKTQAAQVASILRHHSFIIIHELPHKFIARRGSLLLTVIYFEYDAFGNAFTNLGNEENFRWPLGAFPAKPNGRLGNLAFRVVSAEAQREAQLFDKAREDLRSSHLHKLHSTTELLGVLATTEQELRIEVEHEQVVLCLERLVLLPEDFRLVFSAWYAQGQSTPTTGSLQFPSGTGPLKSRRERRRNGLGIAAGARLQVCDNLGTIYRNAEFRESCAGAGHPTWFTWTSTGPCASGARTLTILLERLIVLSSPDPREVYGPWSFTIPIQGILPAVS